MKSSRFKETEIGLIPEDWDFKVFSDIVDIVGGGTPKTTVPEYWDGEIPWLSVVDFNNDFRTVYETEKKISELGLKNSFTKLLKKGDLIISARGTVGVIAQLGRDMAFNQSCYGLKAKNGFKNDFIYYLLKYSLNILKQTTHGSTFDTITTNTFDLLKVPLPTPEEQNVIANILSTIDNKIELNHQINQTLEEIGQAIFQHWFVHFEFPDENGQPYKSSGGEMVDSELGEIPAGWEVGKLKDLGKIVCGKTPPKSQHEYFGGEFPFIKIPDMHGQTFVVKTEDSLTQAGKEFQENKTLPANSVCVSCIATVGLVCINPTDSQTNQQINSIIPKYEFLTPYLYYKMVSMKDFIEILASGGSATLNLNTKNFSNIDILIPDKELLKKYFSFVKPLIGCILNNSIQNENLSQIRDYLLPKLMSGKIRIKPTEEATTK